MCVCVVVQAPGAYRTFLPRTLKASRLGREPDAREVHAATEASWRITQASVREGWGVKSSER